MTMIRSNKFAFSTKSAMAAQRTEKYKEMSSIVRNDSSAVRDTSTRGQMGHRSTVVSDEVNVISIETDFDEEARELYEWSQFL